AGGRVPSAECRVQSIGWVRFNFVFHSALGTRHSLTTHDPRLVYNARHAAAVARARRANGGGV
ncbi:MAG: hypothetical protein AVDCRST_MAG18-616, partial [uncultured Thermomicrobiales bacterium]